MNRSAEMTPTVGDEPAFPLSDQRQGEYGICNEGMSLRDWFAGQALSNPAICTGIASDYQVTAWFGKYRTGITKAEIVARQALDHADVMLAARTQTALDVRGGE